MHILIIGVGSIGERHLRNFLRIDGVTCSIAEPYAALRDKITSQYKVTKSYAHWEDADLSSLQGAVICTPTDMHVPIMTKIVDAGIPALSEKPIAMKMEGGLPELTAKIRQKNAIAGVAFVMRSNPLMGELKENIAAGKVGPILTVNYYASQYWPQMRQAWPPGYAQRRATGGGAIPDHLVHMINLLEWFLGPVQSVAAYQRHMCLEGIESEDYGTVTLRFAGGQVAQITLCLFQRGGTSWRLQLAGREGTLQLGNEDKQISIFAEKTGQWAQGRIHPVERDDLFMFQAQDFINCIRGKAQPRCTVEEAERTLKVVLAAMESSDGNGGFVKVS